MRRAAVQLTDLVDPGLRVAPAVDVDQPLEVREVGGQTLLEMIAHRPQLALADERAGRLGRGR